MSDIKHVSDATFDADVIKADLPVFVDFWAPWCGPCRMIAPLLEKAAEEFDGKIIVAKYNVDESQTIAGELGIRGIPTIVVYKNGTIVDQRSGACDKATLDQFIAKQL